MPNRVLIADDSSMVRTMLTSVINMLADVELAGIATNGQEAIELAAETQPDIILMDLNMPVVNGADATVAILHKHPEIQIIAMTGLGESDLVTRVLDAGAVTCLPKDISLDELIRAIEPLCR